MQQNAKILIVDDEKIALRNLEHVMKKQGYGVVATQSGPNALKLLEEQTFDVVLTDLRMEKVDGMQILKKCHLLYPDTEVIMITGFATLETAVETMKQGGFYYISKPFKLDEVRKIVKEAIEKVRLKNENRQLREQIENYQGKVKIVTQDSKLEKLLDTARQIAPTDCNVLVTGEPYTPPKPLYEGVATSLQSALKGELPQDVVNQLQQRAAEFGVASGLPGSQFAGYQGLRNLGLTSLDRIRDAEKAISQTWMTPEQQGANSLRMMQQNYSNQASQMQLDQARQNQIMNNIAGANRSWAQATGRWNTGGALQEEASKL